MAFDWGFMSKSKKIKVKDESISMYELCLKRASSIGRAEYIRTEGRVDLAESYRTDMMNFLVYLAYSDGDLSLNELKYIDMFFDMPYQFEDISKYADMWDLKTEHIKEKPPITLEAFVRSNVGPETGEISSQYYDLVMLYVTTFNYVGNDFISCDDEVTANEVAALSGYIMMIREYIEIIREKMAGYKPTIEYKSGSSIKQETLEYNKPTIAFRPKKQDEQSVQEDLDFDSMVPLADRKKVTIEKEKKEEKRENLNADITPKATEEREDETQFVGKISEAEDAVNLEELLLELNGLTGMGSVKKEVNNLVNLLKICKIREEKGFKIPPTTNHLVFLGNPGTGKTTVARILAKIYHSLGVLSKGQLVEVDRSGLVAGYMGQTGIKVMEVVEKAKGGVLFIDEAYALSTGQEGDFGKEAIDVLNKAMEDYKDDLIVIVAGYQKEMQSFLDANPGLRSRFNRTINFPNYSAEELLTIMKNRATKLDYTITQDAISHIEQYFKKVLEIPPDNFGNARSVRNYLDNAINNQANRLVKSPDFSDEDLTTIVIADVESLKLT
ncbi:MAG: AAA family ATPase [Clostridium sp.]|nr:AAA family ATPase [Clostridium sp.]MCM1399577.1 AAA family ATPase [Clostridium sp.]MCM1460131.1 AAA family ATPase [Bacteroides sp.]